MLPHVAESQDGVFLRRQAIAAGFSSEEFRSAVRARVWVRLRRGAYALSELHDQASEQERYVMLVRAVQLVLDQPYVASHSSAAALHGLPTWGTDVPVVHMTRAKRRGA